MYRIVIFLLLLFFIFPITCDSNAEELNFNGVCKITMLDNEHLLLQKGKYKRDGNHTCTSVDYYKIEKNGWTFVKTLTCEEAEKYYKRYRGKDYER